MNYIYKNKEPCLYVHKKLAKNFPALLIAYYVNEKVFLSYFYVTHYHVQVSVTQIQH